MDIKDITVSAERMEEVRGGQRINVDLAALQIGGNHAISGASSWGVGNTTTSGVTQIAPQVLSQNVGVHATEIDTHETLIANSIVGFPFLAL